MLPVAMAVTISTVALLSNGCASCHQKVVPKLTVASLPAPKTLGSLWQEENGRAYLYEDMRAMRVGDILTIKIIEKHKGSKSADTGPSGILQFKTVWQAVLSDTSVFPAFASAAKRDEGLVSMRVPRTSLKARAPRIVKEP